MSNIQIHELNDFSGVPGEGDYLPVDNGSETLKLSGGNFLSAVINTVYPIGAIYMSVNDVNPGTLFPGTSWTRITGRFLLASSSTYSIGATGGAATVKLTDEEMAHGHEFTQPTITSNLSATVGYGSGSSTRPYSETGRTGTTTNWNKATGGAVQNLSGASSTRTAHENMPPYLVVNVWKRTS